MIDVTAPLETETVLGVLMLIAILAGPVLGTIAFGIGELWRWVTGRTGGDDENGW